MLDYARGNLSKAQMIRIGQHLETCAFCREALEGIGKLAESEDIDSIVGDINSQVMAAARQQGHNQGFPFSVSRGTRWAIFGAAASIVLIALFSVYLVRLDRLPFREVAEGYQPIGRHATTAPALPEPTTSGDRYSPPVEDLNEAEEDGAIAITEIRKDEEMREKETASKELLAIEDADVPEEVTNAATPPKKTPEAPSREPSLAGGPADSLVNDTTALVIAFEDKAIPVSHQTNSTMSNAPVVTSMATEKVAALEEVRIESPSEEIYAVVETMPVFPGGDAAMRQYFRNSLRIPQEYADSTLSLTVYVECVIDERGKVRFARMREGYSPSLDKAVLRAVRNMPDWTPGEQRGKKVLVRMTIPVNIVHRPAQ